MDKNELESLVEQRLSSRKIAVKLNLSQSTVNYYLKKFNLKTDVRYKNREEEYGVCNNCNLTFTDRWQSKYCSNKCQNLFKSKEIVDKWLNNESTGSTNGGNLSGTCRQYLITECNEKCTKCGWCEPNEVLGRPILTIDHIDGNWKNNRRDNLVVLCYNCHTLTPTFGSLNKNSTSNRPVGTKNRYKNK